MPEQYQHLRLAVEGGVALVTLNRPEVRNAFNPTMIEEIRSAFEDLAERWPGEVRVAVLAGNGRSFCAGADVNWMRESLDYGAAENVADAFRMAHMFETIDACPFPVIGRIHGAAMGGGCGLAAVCDIVVAADDVVWAFSEAKLGIAPAVISPFVLAKIGRSNARALFLTAERFSSGRAQEIGLAHFVVKSEELDGTVDRLVREVLTAAPHGIARAKELIARIPALTRDEGKQLTAETIAALRVSPEGQEGLRAFLEKRKPEWAQ